MLCSLFCSVVAFIMIGTVCKTLELSEPNCNTKAKRTSIVDDEQNTKQRALYQVPISVDFQPPEQTGELKEFKRPKSARVSIELRQVACTS